MKSKPAIIALLKRGAASIHFAPGSMSWGAEAAEYAASNEVVPSRCGDCGMAMRDGTLEPAAEVGRTGLAHRYVPTSCAASSDRSEVARLWSEAES